MDYFGIGSCYSIVFIGENVKNYTFKFAIVSSGCFSIFEIYYNKSATIGDFEIELLYRHNFDKNYQINMSFLSNDDLIIYTDETKIVYNMNNNTLIYTNDSNIEIFSNSILIKDLIVNFNTNIIYKYNFKPILLNSYLIGEGIKNIIKDLQKQIKTLKIRINHLENNVLESS